MDCARLGARDEGLKMRHPRQRLLELAVRVRRWTLDQQLQALQAATSAEGQAEEGYRAADLAVRQARHAQRHLLAGRQFMAQQALQHAAYEDVMRDAAVQASGRLTSARAEVQSQQQQVQTTLGERDAYERRLRAYRDQAFSEEARAAARLADEAWLIGKGMSGDRDEA